MAVITCVIRWLIIEGLVPRLRAGLDLAFSLAGIPLSDDMGIHGIVLFPRVMLLMMLGGAASCTSRSLASDLTLCP